MAQSTITFRVEDDLKNDFETLCNEFGFNYTAAFTVFMKAVVREKRIPFEIRASQKATKNTKTWDSFLKMRQQAAEAGLQDLSLEEINGIIKEVRDEK